MCVIVVSEEPRAMSSEDFFSAAETHGDGIGITWKLRNLLQIRKTLKAKAAWKLYKGLETPSLLHFRWATEGKVSPENCHPFVVGWDTRRNFWETKDSSWVYGHARRVLAHNGHVAGWEARGKSFGAPTKRFQVDSELIAWCAAEVKNLAELSKLFPSEKIAIWNANDELPKTLGHFTREGKTLLSNTWHLWPSYRNSRFESSFHYSKNSFGQTVISNVAPRSQKYLDDMWEELEREWQESQKTLNKLSEAK